MQVAGYQGTAISVIDVTCTLIFLIEMLVKHIHLGVRGYWREGWNKTGRRIGFAIHPIHH